MWTFVKQGNRAGFDAYDAYSGQILAFYIEKRNNLYQINS